MTAAELQGMIVDPRTARVAVLSPPNYEHPHNSESSTAETEPMARQPTQPSRDILERFRNRGNWLPVASETVRNIVDHALKSDAPLDQETALLDFHYWINRGQLKSYTYYAKRWKWGSKKAYNFFHKHGVLGAETGEKIGRGRGENGERKSRNSAGNRRSGEKIGRGRGENGEMYVEEEKKKEKKNSIPADGEAARKGNARKAEKPKTPRAERLAAIYATPAGQLYRAYPRHDDFDKGLAAIEKALREEEFDFLLERVQAFARLWPDYSKLPDAEQRLCPLSASWFNDKRYHAETWKGAPSLADVLKPLSYSEAYADSAKRGFHGWPNANYLPVIGAKNGAVYYIRAEDRSKRLPEAARLASDAEAAEWAQRQRSNAGGAR